LSTISKKNILDILGQTLQVTWTDVQMAFCPSLRFSLTILLVHESDFLKPFATQATSMQFVVTVTLHEYNLFVFLKNYPIIILVHVT